MKQFLVAGVLALTASSAQAFDFFDNNSGEWKMGPNGPYYDESNWPQWTPMYWMEEMMDTFDDEGGYGGNGFNMPFTNGNGFNMPFTNNNGFNMPFNAQMPNMGYGQPMYYPAPMQYQMPQMQMQQYQMPAPTMAAPVAPTAPVAPAAPVTTAPGPAANSSK